MQKVNGLPWPAHMRRLRDRQKKDKNIETILFVDWPRKEPENKKWFEDVPRKKEINGRWNATPEKKKETYV